MTTDITELAQSLRRRAASANEFGEGLFFIKADDVLALVEALEKAQRTQTCEHSMFWDASGVKRCSKCDLPEHANVHYADAAEMEIAALRQRIAELESSTVKLPKPHAHLIWIQAGHAPDDFWDDVAVSHSEKDRCCDGSERYPVYARWEIEEMLAAAGIKVEAE
ncbi:ead/Ea22-like family protein [Klebsiella pneumoniae]|nr:ead/Ea22-like family protein [Klebsiella pneumoniae]